MGTPFEIFNSISNRCLGEKNTAWLGTMIRFYVCNDADRVIEQLQSKDKEFEDWGARLKTGTLGPGTLHLQTFEKAEIIKKDIQSLEAGGFGAISVLHRIWSGKDFPYIHGKSLVTEDNPQGNPVKFKL